MTAAALTLFIAAGGADALVGKLRVEGPAQSRSVALELGAEIVALSGELVLELEQLASAKVEVLGARTDTAFRVQSYRILDVGGGAQPLVGELVLVGDRLALRDGSGTPIALSLPPKSRARLAPKVGAKIWVHGSKLVSGEVKVGRYGILREPPIIK